MRQDFSPVLQAAYRLLGNNIRLTANKIHRLLGHHRSLEQLSHRFDHRIHCEIDVLRFCFLHCPLPRRKME